MHSIFVIKRKFYISQTEMTKIYLSLLIIFYLSLFFLFLFSIYFAFSFERDIFIRLFPNPRIINNIENFEQLRNNQEVGSINHPKNHFQLISHPFFISFTALAI